MITLIVISSKVLLGIKCNNACKIRWSEHSEIAIEVGSYYLEPRYSKWDPQTSNLGITWELVRNAVSGCMFMHVIIRYK